MSIGYEWIVEEVDEHGDIVDTSAYDTAIDAFRAMRAAPEPGLHYDFGLTRNEGDDDVGLQERAWAYVNGNRLPDAFDDGKLVPKRFHAELARARGLR